MLLLVATDVINKMNLLEISNTGNNNKHYNDERLHLSRNEPLRQDKDEKMVSKRLKLRE